MLIIALVLALTGLIALVFAVVTSNELVAWVCIGASALGVVLLIIDALRERQRRESGSTPEQSASAQTERELEQDASEYPGASAADSGTTEDFDADYPEDAADIGEQDADVGVEASSPQADSAVDDDPRTPAEDRGGDAVRGDSTA